MAEDLIRYDVLVQDALRGVVRKVLAEASKAGLPGDHHFYVAFDTRAPGVRMSSRLKERYPEEMTIVLQHQFWDFAVTEQYFEVGLSFGGVPERLHIPFAAIKGFFDPSVEFGLQFEVKREEEAGEEADSATSATPLKPVERPADTPEAAAAADTPAEKGAVVSLDAFRKKT